MANVDCLSLLLCPPTIKCPCFHQDESQGYENMEILAKLLRSIGGKLDSTSRSSKDGKAVAEYFKRIEKIKEEANSKVSQPRQYQMNADIVMCIMHDFGPQVLVLRGPVYVQSVCLAL